MSFDYFTRTASRHNRKLIQISDLDVSVNAHVVCGAVLVRVTYRRHNRSAATQMEANLTHAALCIQCVAVLSAACRGECNRRTLSATTMTTMSVPVRVGVAICFRE